MDEVQKFHPAAEAVQQVCRQVFNNPLAPSDEVKASVLPLNIIMMMFTESEPSKFFSKEFLSVLMTEKEIFDERHEFNANVLVRALRAETERILGIDD